MFACMLCPLAASAADDPALVPVKVNFAPGKAYASETRKWQGIPGIERAPNGRLWALWYTGGKSEGPDNYVVLVTSGDDGKTWSPPVLVIDPPGLVRAYDLTLWHDPDGELWHDPDGKLWLFWAQAYNWWDGRSGVWTITTRQSGKPTPTWTKPRRLTDGIMMNKPTVLKNGLWVLPAAIWEGKPRTDKYAHDMGDRKGGRLVASADHGKTWKGGLLIDGRGGVSYLDAVETPEDLVYLIYDYSRHGAKEILLATFTEADVLAGKNVSGKLRLRVLVDKAGPKPPASRP